MKTQLLLCIWLLILNTTSKTADTQWAIVGAGPAGITVIGVLIDLGVDPQDITWIDPEFKAGRLGKYYASVPANIKTKYFHKFIKSCNLFMQVQSASIQALFNDYDPYQEYPLHNIVNPLLDITEYLCKKVHKKQAMLTSLNCVDNMWRVGTTHEEFSAANVVLATGSRPCSAQYSECTEIIPLDLALDKNKLATLIQPHDTIAVVGSSHSAILLLKFLSELPVARVINFYKHPLIYDKNEIGLMGITQWWAQNILETNPPANLLRVVNTQENRTEWLSLCDKVIYAIGFERNYLPKINECKYIDYDDQTGMIGPQLYGIGIAFPETYTDEETGKKIPKVGLMGFMKYAKRVVPQWLERAQPREYNKTAQCRCGVNCSSEKQAMIIQNY